MFFESPNYQINSLDDFSIRHVLEEAKKAVTESSYGVGGALINLRSGTVIKTMHNTVIARDNESELSRLKDPTAHGERQLVDWYFANKLMLRLPEPQDILIVTSLDPCLMCTGSILSAGFSVAVVALDDNAGINWDNTYVFSPLEGDVLKQAQNTFIYPQVTGDSARNGYGTVPLFTEDTLSKTTTDDCFSVFMEGATAARDIVKSIIPENELWDVTGDSNAEAISVINALRAVYPDAITYKTVSGTRIPDEGLSDFLIAAAKEDLLYGGDGDAVAFLDYFGNLMMCKPGKKSESPIRSAFMETARAYQSVRYSLSKTSKDLLKYLCDPTQGAFIFVKGFDKSAQSFADLGAYGSVMINAVQEHNLQYITPRIAHDDLLKYISGMPDRYANAIKPERVTNNALISKVESEMPKPNPNIYERRIDIPFPQGYYVTGCVSAQASNCVNLLLSDETKQYYTFTQQSTQIKPQAIPELYVIEGEHLRLNISLSGTFDNKRIRLSEGLRAVTDESGVEKALEYSLFLEDSTDSDYNDLHITLTAWKTKN